MLVCCCIFYFLVRVTGGSLFLACFGPVSLKILLKVNRERKKGKCSVLGIKQSCAWFQLILTSHI